ncbi:glycerol-3-phosphate 1-O-acyltransferase PlsB [Marinobacterium jannaschii]|uniref:glycerol-3-phosphate 1-O-acyltransferase PlsB n=1 Tax=Marinobacterium jannaschii TaxID=64970 RepID=UPI00048710F9|nr:glycerol-3-phosphate 1-O-acyltransferase PlsB [Marinobacterium jannaschii]
MNKNAPLIQRLAARLLRLIVRPTLLGRANLNHGGDVYYVLETPRSSHRTILRGLSDRLIADHRFLYAHSDGRYPLREAIDELSRMQHSNSELDIQLVPVTIYHGRMPERQQSWLNLLYAETWHRAGALGRALQLLVNGRATLVQASESIALKSLIAETPDAHATIARKASRVLRSHFKIRRQAIIGPDLSHRRTLLQEVLRHPKVQQALDQQSAATGSSRISLEQQALAQLDKIAANFSPLTVRLLNPLFDLLWRKLYYGVEVQNIDRIRAIAGTHQLVYLPCHRSHMDYLLLSWALYRQGLMLPHVAAGENLNIPLIGPILKRGGAIFMRRSFRDDPVYSALYAAYLEQISHRGHSIEYFIEGGRSRSGRLLPAKTGLLAMTLETSRGSAAYPVTLVPVWIGYDRLVESHSYQQELEGQRKQGESLQGVLSMLKILRQRFGNCYLSFGEPLTLAAAPGNREYRPAELGKEVLRRINQAACITPNAIVATTLLAAPRQTLDCADLGARCQGLQQLLSELTDSGRQVNGSKTDHWIGQCQKLQQLTRSENRVQLNPAQAREMTFYRNNLLHLLVIPGLYLLLCHRLGPLPSQSVNRILKLLIPYLDAELQLPWDDASLTTEIRRIRDRLAEKGLLRQQRRQWQTNPLPLAQTLIQTVEPLLLRYYLTLLVLKQHPQISRDDLIRITATLATELHKTYGFSSPEYSDKRVLGIFIDQLIEREILQLQQGRICCLSDTRALLRHARRTLGGHLTESADRLIRTL